MDACTQQAYDALLAASWTRVAEKEAGLPRHNWAQTGFSNRWDAAKYCGDYADGYQHGYATAVCYTIRMPADALAGTVAKIVSLAIPVYGDRWLADGCDVLVYLSDSVNPPEWGATADDSVTGQLEVVPANDGTDTSATVAFDWSATPKTSLAYLHIVLKLTNYLTHRGAWIEGGAMIDGANIAVTFDRDVTPDTSVELEDDVYRVASGQFAYDSWSPFTMHSTVKFRPVSAAAFGSEGIGFYKEVVAAMSVPSFKNWTYVGGVWSNVNGSDYPLSVGVIRNQFREEGATADTVLTNVVGSVFGRSSEVPEGYSVNAISFGSIFPDPPAGMTIRLAFYGADAYRGNCWSSSTEADFGKTMVFPSRIAPSSAMNPNFWKGTATEMKGIEYDNSMGALYDNPPPAAGATGSMVAVSFPITPLCSFTTTTGYTGFKADKFYLDTPWKAPAHAMIILALSVASIESVPDPPLTGSGVKYYGINWFCPYLNFHFVKNV
jgi:hypothetical protein